MIFLQLWCLLFLPLWFALFFFFAVACAHYTRVEVQKNINSKGKYSASNIERNLLFFRNSSLERHTVDHFALFSFQLVIYYIICCCDLVARSCLNLLQPPGLYLTRLLYPWDFPGKNTGVGCCFLLQGIFPTHGSNLPRQHWQADTLPLNHQGSPILHYTSYHMVHVSPLSRKYLFVFCGCLSCIDIFPRKRQNKNLVG